MKRRRTCPDVKTKKVCARFIRPHKAVRARTTPIFAETPLSDDASDQCRAEQARSEPAMHLKLHRAAVNY